jgi:hypothetical protein
MFRCSPKEDDRLGIYRVTAEANQGAVTLVVNEVWPVTLRSPRPRQLLLDHGHEALQRLSPREQPAVDEEGRGAGHASAGPLLHILCTAA